MAETTSPKSIRLPDDVWVRLDALAAERETTRNALIAQALAALLDPQPAPIPLAHTPSPTPQADAAQAARPTARRRNAPNFGPKVDTSAVPYLGDLQASRPDRMKR